MTKTLEMVFRNAEGKQVTLNLAEPKATLTKAEAETVMQNIVSKNIFITKGGELVESIEARIRSNDTVVLA